MTIKQLKRVFISELAHLYPITEIESFFNILSMEYLKLSRTEIALNFNDEVIIPEKFHTALDQLVKQSPIQYITGKTEFYGLDFLVNSNVLIPRPETEELVDWIVRDADKHQTINSKLNILDIGTGSGCIAISLAKSIVLSNVYALDVSEKALITAKQNAIKNNVKIHFILDNILKKGVIAINTKFDIIVSNPPYVRNLEKKEIQNNVLKNEPHLALFVEDKKPLLFYEAISNFAVKNLTKNGILYFEINQYLSKETIHLLRKKGFKNIELRKDIFNNDRMIKCTF